MKKKDHGVKDNNFEVIASLDENRLSAFIKYNGEQDLHEIKYDYFLIKDGKVVDRVYARSNKHIWDLHEDGIYTIQGYIKKNGTTSDFIRSHPAAYFTNRFKDAFHDSLQTQTDDDNPLLSNLEYQSLKGDFSDFLIFTHKSDEIDIKKIESTFYNKLHNNANLSSQNIKIFTSENTYIKSSVIISGTIINDEEGLDDRHINATGCFSFIDCRNEKFLVGADFFGFNRIFYIDQPDIQIISNRYHTILLAAKALGIPLQLDIDKICAHFWSGTHQLSSQNFTAAMDVKPIYQLPPYFYFLFDNGKWKKQENEHYFCLFNNERNVAIPFSDKFNAAIDKAAAEIIEITNSIYRTAEKKSKTIVCDLTGGLDSRTVFAAVTNINHSRRNTQIHSRPTPNSNDLQIACAVNSIYNYEFDTGSVLIEELSLNESNQYLRSHFLGMYFSRNIIKIRKAHNAVQLTGACGEILGRPYIPRNYFFNGTATNNFDKNLRLVISDLTSSAILDYEDGLKHFEKFYKEELQSTPNLSLFEAIDRNYLQFRHGPHFDSSIMHVYNGENSMPLQSKTLYKLHHECYNSLSGLEIQLSLIAKLNPLLLNLPFESNKDNEDHLIIKDKIRIHNAQLTNMNPSINYDTTSWHDSQKEKGSKIKKIKANPEAKINDMNLLLFEAIKSLLRKCMKEPSIKLSEKFYFCIFHFIQRNIENTWAMTVIYNKLISLIDQHSICHQNN